MHSTQAKSTFTSSAVAITVLSLPNWKKIRKIKCSHTTIIFNFTHTMHGYLLILCVNRCDYISKSSLPLKPFLFFRYSYFVRQAKCRLQNIKKLFEAIKTQQLKSVITANFNGKHSIRSQSLSYAQRKKKTTIIIEPNWKFLCQAMTKRVDYMQRCIFFLFFWLLFILGVMVIIIIFVDFTSISGYLHHSHLFLCATCQNFIFCFFGSFISFHGASTPHFLKLVC